MENLSKVLVIVASVLAAILVVSVAVFVFNMAKDPVAQSVDGMTTEERNFFNTKFQRYEGGRVAGIETKALVNISMQNANYQLSLNEKYRIPEIYIKYKDNTKISLEREEINAVTDSEAFKNKFQRMLNKINNASFYSIDTELSARNGIVSMITIEEVNI